MDIKYKGLLQPWNQEMSSFTNSFVDYTVQPIEEDSAFADIDSVQGCNKNCPSSPKAKSSASKVGEQGRCSLVTSHS